MITFIYVVSSLASLVHSGIITHDLGGDDGHDKATSFQNIHMEHFHAVPTYIKKEYKHLLEHPIPAGKSSSKVEIHHGGKHDHGYAIVNAQNNAHGSGSHEDTDLGVNESASLGGQEGASLDGHEGPDLGEHKVSGHLVAQAIANAGLTHRVSGGYQVNDQNQELLQHQAVQIAQNRGALHLQAAAALGHVGASLGHAAAGLSHGGAALGHDGIALDHYQAAAATENHQGYGATLANTALHVQNGLAGHEHNS